MAVLNLIGETFRDQYHAANACALRDLAVALVKKAPRSCAVRVILPRDQKAPKLPDARISFVHMPITSNSLNIIWQTGAAAKPLAGEMVHAISALTPLSSSKQAQGAQNTVCVQHTDIFDPETPVKLQQRFTKRALRNADIVFAPSHKAADFLNQLQPEAEIRVLPLAAPLEYRPAPDSAERRRKLNLPADYLLTTAPASAELDLLIDAVEKNPELPQLVVLQQFAESEKAPAIAALPAVDTGAKDADINLNDMPQAENSIDSAAESKAPTATDRVLFITPLNMHDFGAAIAGAQMLVMPHTHIGPAYEVYGALTAGVPLLHIGNELIAEICQDAAIDAETNNNLSAKLTELFTAETAKLTDLQVLAKDRASIYSFENIAEILWETHASL